MTKSAPHLEALSAREDQRHVSKEELLRPRKVTEEVEISGLDGVVTIRSLSFTKRQEIQKKSKVGTEEFDSDFMTMLSIKESLVDPELTEEDLVKLKEQDASIIDELSVAISMLNLTGRSSELKKGSKKTQN